MSSFPCEKTLQQLCKLACQEDKPVLYDYWMDSLDKKVFIGVKEDQEKLLIRSKEEYTSCIQKIYKVESEYIIQTENSIYVVSSSIPTKKIKL